MNEGLQVLNGNSCPSVNLPENNENTHPTVLTISHPFTNYQDTLYLDFPLSGSVSGCLKRLSDVCISVFFIVAIFSWLAPIIALFVVLNSKGPVFFLQARTKKKGVPFTCIKFRSMVVNPYSDRLTTVENDNRITSVGKYLRKYHLDELPQLFNVLFGDMSIIGPRPHMITENQNYQRLLPNYDFRHRVKPGITGLAQSLGYHGSSYDAQKIQKRLDLDIQYITEWSIAMDVKILFRTMRMLCHK